MTRAEHMRWCKRRALEYLDAGDRRQAISSFLSDLTKNEETEPLVNSWGGQMALFELASGDAVTTRQFIQGFAE